MLFTIDLKTPSLNDWYAGSHWGKRDALKKLWRGVIMVYCKKKKIVPFASFPLRVTTQPVYSDKRKRDTDNTITAAKLFIDALKHLELIPEDDPRYIGKITLLPPSHGDSDYTIIKVEEE